MSVKAKICGLTDDISVDATLDYGASYIGFVFFPPSSRNISPEKAAILSEKCSNINTVAVVVNPSDESIKAILDSFKPDYFQLHGAEKPSRVIEIKKKYGVSIIKAITVRYHDDIVKGMTYEDSADMLLFDAKTPEFLGKNLPGGNGVAFDWNLLSEVKFSVPWILSGGLNAENVEEAISITGAKIVDVSSGVESDVGVKNPKLIKEFLKMVSRCK